MSDVAVAASLSCQGETAGGIHELSTPGWALDEHDRSMLRTIGPTEGGIEFGVLFDEELAQARGLNVRLLGK